MTCQHEPVDVEALNGDAIWICGRCLERIIPIRPHGVPLSGAAWRLYESRIRLTPRRH